MGQDSGAMGQEQGVVVECFGEGSPITFAVTSCWNFWI